MDTITITGPNIATVVHDAIGLHRDICAGQWGAAVELTRDHWNNPEAATEAFNTLGNTIERTGWNPAEPGTDEMLTANGGDQITWTGNKRTLISAVDLYMRIHCGQFEELSWYGGRTDNRDTCGRLRIEHQKPGAWPDHIHASWGISAPQVPDSARSCYDIWKHLGGGVPDRGFLRPGLITVTHTSTNP